MSSPQETVCETCEGTGMVNREFIPPYGYFHDKCKACNGIGKRPAQDSTLAVENCRFCNASGFMPSDGYGSYDPKGRYKVPCRNKCPKPKEEARALAPSPCPHGCNDGVISDDGSYSWDGEARLKRCPRHGGNAGGLHYEDCPSPEAPCTCRKGNAEGTAPESFYMRDLTPAEQAQHREAIKAQMVAPEPLLSDAEIDEFASYYMPKKDEPFVHRLCAQAKLANRPASEAQGAGEGFCADCGGDNILYVTQADREAAIRLKPKVLAAVKAALTAPDRPAPSREGWLTREEVEAEAKVPAFQVANEEGITDLKACRAYIFDKLCRMALAALEGK